MSLTSHLLFNAPTVLPIGKERIHRMSGKWVDESSTTNSRLDCPVAASSVERVYIAVKSGLRSSENVNSRVSVCDAARNQSAQVRRLRGREGKG